MNKTKFITILQVAFGLMVLGFIGWLLFFLSKLLIIGFSHLQKEVSAAIIAVSGTIIVSVFSLIFSKMYERKREIDQEHRKQKIPIYEELLKFMFRLLQAGKPGHQPVPEEETIKFLTEFTQKLIIWGSDGVMKQFTTWRASLLNQDPQKPNYEGLFLFEKLLMEIRKDVGHKNKNIKKGDILGLFINDIEKYI
jgi:hypothetical protein